MGAAPSSLPTSSSSPPATIVLNLSDVNNNTNKMDDELDLEQSTSAVTMADKIKALTTMRDKTYQKLGKVSVSLNEESALLLERKIKRYDARIETLKDQEDRYYKEYALHRDDILQRNSQLNSQLILFAVLQGLLVVAASFVLAYPMEDSEGVTQGKNTSLHYVLLILTALGMAVSLVTMLKMWDIDSQMDEILQLWERQRANEMISRTFSSSEQSLNVHGCRRDLRPDLILPIVFLAGWFCGFLLLLPKLA